MRMQITGVGDISFFPGSSASKFSIRHFCLDFVIFVCYLYYTLFILHVVYITRYLYYTLFILHVVYITRYLYYTLFILHVIYITRCLYSFKFLILRRIWKSWHFINYFKTSKWHFISWFMVLINSINRVSCVLWIVTF